MVLQQEGTGAVDMFPVLALSGVHFAENRRFLVLYFVSISQQSLPSIARAHRYTIATSNHAVRPV